jgi:hypothetical protein
VSKSFLSLKHEMNVKAWIFFKSDASAAFRVGLYVWK